MAWYRTGSVTLTPGSNLVLGTGTSFLANVKVGDMFIDKDAIVYEITNVLADAQLQIKPAFSGTPYTGTDWSIAPTAANLKVLSKSVTDLVAIYQDIPENVEVAQGAVAQTLAYRNDAVTAKDAADLAKQAAEIWRNQAVEARGEAEAAADLTVVKVTEAEGARLAAIQAAADAAASSNSAQGIVESASSALDAKVSQASVSATAAAVAASNASAVLEGAATKEALAAAAGLPILAYSAGDAQSILDNALPMQSYTALRAYTGRAAGVRITTPGIAGTFQRDPSDTESADNGGTIIVDAMGRRWKRQYSGPAMVEWWGATGIGNDGPALQLALDFGGCLYFRRHYITAQELFAWKEGTRLIGAGAAWGGEVTSGARIVADVGLNSKFIIEFKNPSRGALRSVGMENICIDGGASNAGGLAVRGAYDASEFKNINIINVPGARVGLEVSAGNTITREGPVQTSTFKNIWALHRDGGVCTRPAVILGDIHESTAENVKGSHGSNSSTVEAFVVQSCNGFQLVTPSAINVSGYGIVVRENHGPCVGVTIISPTYEKCKQPFGTDSKDSRLFGAGLPIVPLGSVVRQPADGSTASGTVWQSTAVGIYAKDTIGAFTLGNVYDGSGNLIGEITAMPSVGNSSIRHINPRTLSVNLSGAAQSVFKSLSRSEVELPMDTQATPKHTYLVAADVANSLFREREWGLTTNLSATSRVESGVGEILMDYPDRWPLSGTAVNLANFSTQSRVRITKNGGSLAVTIAGSGISIGKYGTTTLTMYEGYITLQRSGANKWEIADMGGTIKDAAQGMICGIPRVVAVTETTTFDSTAHDRRFTNTGATGPIAINAGTAGGTSPANAIGTRVTLTKTVAQTFYFKPNSADTVLGASAAGKYISPANIGSSVTLECVAANTWAVVASAGTLTYEA